MKLEYNNMIFNVTVKEIKNGHTVFITNKGKEIRITASKIKSYVRNGELIYYTKSIKKQQVVKKFDKRKITKKRLSAYNINERAESLMRISLIKEIKEKKINMLANSVKNQVGFRTISKSIFTNSCYNI